MNGQKPSLGKRSRFTFAVYEENKFNLITAKVFVIFKQKLNKTVSYIHTSSYV